MHSTVTGVCVGLVLSVGVGMVVSAQTPAVVTTTATPRWEMGSSTEPLTLAEANSSRVLAFVNGEATKVRANITDTTAVGVPIAFTCSGTNVPFACVSTTTAQQLAGGAATGTFLVSLTYERRYADGTYAPRVMGVPTACDFTFRDTRPSVPGRNIRYALAEFLGLVEVG